MAETESVNNDFYQNLGEKWLQGQDHPIALLRAEAGIKHAWVEQQLKDKQFYPIGFENSQILDVGCGAGFLSIHLAEKGHSVTGLDLSEGVLKVANISRASLNDQTQSRLKFTQGSGEILPFPTASFSVVCCMDVLEHVKDPAALVKECIRVLQPGGLFFFHTFNRTFLSKMLVIYGVNFFFKNVPKNLHLYDWFITPKEMQVYCQNEFAEILKMTGLRPRIRLSQAWQILRTGHVPMDFEFELCPSLMIGYMGVARKSQIDL